MSAALQQRTDLGTRPELAWVPVDACTVDARYQRSLESERSRATIAKIAAGFDWAMFGSITVVRDRKHRFVVIDGQHRLAAAAQRSIDSVPAVIVKGDTVELQAKIFVAANRDRVSLTPLALHRAAVAAGDQRARDIEGAAKKAGIKIAAYPVPANKMPPGMTLAVSTIARCVKMHGVEITAAALAGVAEAWPVGGGLAAHRILGTALAMATSSAAEVAKVLRLPGMAARCDRESYSHGTRADGVRAALIDAVRAASRGAAPAGHGPGIPKGMNTCSTEGCNNPRQPGRTICARCISITLGGRA